MINSILDNDLYKFTMQAAVLELFPTATVEYEFINRGKQRFNQLFLSVLRGKISEMDGLYLRPAEKEWFKKTCPYFKTWYFDYLENYRFNPDEVDLSLTIDNNLQLKVKGSWHRAILWEVPLLALISETYFEIVDTAWQNKVTLNEYEKLFCWKMGQLEATNCHTSDFGTRRRRALAYQEIIVRAGLKFPKNFSGTSNVYLAMKYGFKPRGTMAHEWIMGNSVLEGLRNANYYALQNWVKVYNADLGIALTDTYGLQAFLGNFNLRLAKLYDGVRHDSGDPFKFVDLIVAHYKGLGIDPMSKVALFSDALDVAKAMAIKLYCEGKIQASFGIGTNFTNDFTCVNSPALNMVIKMFSLNDIPVVKLGEDPRKACGDKDAIRVAKWTFYNEPLDSK